jgi:hypothetical protein
MEIEAALRQAQDEKASPTISILAVADLRCERRLAAIQPSK